MIPVLKLDELNLPAFQVNRGDNDLVASDEVVRGYNFLVHLVWSRRKHQLGQQEGPSHSS